MRNALFFLAVTLMAAAAVGQPIELWVGFEIPYRSGPHPVGFVSDELPVRLSLRASENEMFLPEGWESRVRWRFQDENGVDVAEPTLIRVGHTLRDGRSMRGATELRPGEIIEVSVVLTAPATPGVYSVTAQLGDERVSDRAYLLIARGDENPALNALWLRTLADRIRSRPARCSSPECRAERWEKYKSVMLQLTTVVSTDPGVWESLGDTSLGNAPPEETLSYYERSRRLSEANLIEKFGSLRALPPDTRTQWERREREMTLFARKVYPYILEHPTIHLVADRQVRRQKVFFAWYNGGEKPVEFSDFETPVKPRPHR